MRTPQMSDLGVPVLLRPIWSTIKPCSDALRRPTTLSGLGIPKSDA